MTPEVSILLEQWADAEEVLDLDLVQATVDLLKASDDPAVQDQCGELLSGVYHYALDESQVRKLDKILNY